MTENETKSDLKDKLEEITATSLLEDFQSPETKTKINAIKNLRGISFALGCEKTRKELLSYLISDVGDEEENEVLIELSKVLSNFIDCIGGQKYIKDLFNLFEAILSVDEPIVRKEAISSLCEAIKQVNNLKDIENDLMEMIRNLNIGDNINQKLGSLNIIIFVYKELSDNNKTIVLDILDKFAVDDNISIKKELLSELPKISLLLSIDYIKNIINTMLKDKNDTVKVDIINFIVSLGGHKKLILLLDFIYDLIPKLAEDQNWRTRMTIAEKLCDILKFPNINNKFKQISINIFVKIMEDNEPEVRNAFCLKLEEIVNILKNDFNFDKILQNLSKTTKDTKNFVKISLSEKILKIIPLIGPQKTNDYIYPIFNSLINDENLDIRLELINNLSKLINISEINKLIPKIIPSIVEISKNKSWRVRMQILDNILIFANILYKNQLFMKDIFPICLNSLTDHVFAIRDQGCKLLTNIYKDIKNIEVENGIKEKLNNMMGSSSYLVRNTIVIFIKYFVDKIGDRVYFEFFEKKLIDIVFILTNDKISNVRINCAIIFNKVKNLSFSNKNINEKIKKCIDVLEKDSDKDVILALK